MAEPITFRADRATYWRDHAWLAALAMAVGMGVLCKPADHGMPRLAQSGRQVAGELPETLAQMQVARMDKAEGHEALVSCFAI